MVSKRQIDLLGERLKVGPITEADLGLLDEYRRQFEPAMAVVMQALKEEFKLQPAARPAKSTIAIVEKLRRETIRLSQIQDIAGCRLIVEDVAEQKQWAQLLSKYFRSMQVIDRTVKPSYGYRAIHIAAKVNGFRVEIQVRTLLQHLWAQLSEALADKLGAEIKYGGGEERAKKLLTSYAALISRYESLEIALPTNRLAELVHPSGDEFRQIRQIGLNLTVELQEFIRAIDSPSMTVE